MMIEDHELLPLIDALTQYDENSEDVYEDMPASERAKVDAVRSILARAEALFVGSVA